jgi:methyltransferase of ATP-grasp peptide maturase system
VTSAARRRAHLVRALRTAGYLADPAWRAAFADVPREAFLPEFFRPSGDGRWVAVGTQDPDWLERAYSDEALPTQLDDDPERWRVARANGPVPGVPTCSSSQPTIMALMLHLLAVRPGQRVLEIGTGTGYHAALLCHRLGDAGVHTVDVDAGLSALAKARLADLGYAPTCAAADGAAGYPAGAPYDRVIATCSVATIPMPWLAQTVPGGLVLTTLRRPLGSGMVLITSGDGPTGEGRVMAEGGRFMPLRAHRFGHAPASGDAEGTLRTTTLGADVLVGHRSPFEFYAGLCLPRATAIPDGDGGLSLTDPDGSWARHTGTEVRQGGRRHLWDEVEAAHDQWQALGAPARDRFGITVTPARQTFWLDEPASRHVWPL